jgi:S-formylglutathione hydrolase FrmB
MRKSFALLALLGGVLPAFATFTANHELRHLNRQLTGQVVDIRIPSAILDQPRDLYVYLPPGYDPCRAYPLVLWLHGGGDDERSFLDLPQLAYLDGLIARGQFPPAIVAGLDGTARSHNVLNPPHSLFINGLRGRFTDHVMQEVIPFLSTRYNIRPEKEAHALIGISAGGFGAANLGLKRRDYFGSVVSIAGGLNLLYHTRQGDYFADFDPCTYRSRTEYNSREVLMTFAGGLVRLTPKQLWEPIFGPPPGILERIRAENPADLLCSTNLQPDELSLYVGYGAKDHLNMDAQAESFAWLTRQRGVAVTCDRDPEGGHDKETLRKLHRQSYPWLARHLAPPSPAR